jgi:hypothetical protein
MAKSNKVTVIKSLKNAENKGKDGWVECTVYNPIAKGDLDIERNSGHEIIAYEHLMALAQIIISYR